MHGDWRGVSDELFPHDLRLQVVLGGTGESGSSLSSSGGTGVDGLGGAGIGAAAAAATASETLSETWIGLSFGPSSTGGGLAGAGVSSTVECLPVVHGGMARNSSNVRTRGLQQFHPF